jgi:hypothetical protein
VRVFKENLSLGLLTLLFAGSCFGLMYAMDSEQKRLAQSQQYAITITFTPNPQNAVTHPSAVR